MKKEALFYKKEDDNYIRCELCPHNCIISENSRGVCNIREASGGKLHTLNYGAISSAAIDPIEKKPLYHFKPGSPVLSVGSFGCNFRCGFCQNYSISKEIPKTQYISPEELVEIALDKKSSGNIGIAFTYNEPSIWYEYVYDTSKIAKNKSLDLILVTNGFISKEPLLEILPYISAMNIDLKAFNNDFYRTTCGGDVESVKNTISLAVTKCHVEIATLLVNGYNDSGEEVENLSRWLASVSPNLVLHLTRYYPNYKFDDPPTPEETLLKSYDIAKKHLNYVYLGNMSGVNNNTCCPKCRELLVKRGFYGVDLLIDKPECPKCGYKINMVL